MTSIAPNTGTIMCRPLSCDWANSQNAHLIHALCIYFFMNTNNQRLAPLRNVTSPGQRRPQNGRENRFDTDRSGRSVTMPKWVGILVGRADRAVTLWNICIWINSNRHAPVLHYTSLLFLHIVMSVCFCFGWKETDLNHFRPSSVSFIFVMRAFWLTDCTELVTYYPWLILSPPLGRNFTEYLLCWTLIPPPGEVLEITSETLPR